MRSRVVAVGVRRLGLVLAALVAVVGGAGVAPASAAPARINGGGSTYVALAMQQWVADGQTNGLQINYLPTGSPDGLTQYGNGVIDFAGTEAEFSALAANGGSDGSGTRGYQYVPDVAGAISVMYNIDDRAGRSVNYLHLSRRTIARIFTGDISRWSDPAISAENKTSTGKEIVFPDEPITVVYRSSPSGTTALFYDFVANAAPDIFGPWAARNQLPTSVRIISLQPGFAPKTISYSGSDQIAQAVASPSGKWSIAYDEFGYAKTYHVNSAWVQNAAGKWVQPYAANISAALEGAKLRPDLSQELAGVYNSPHELAYPISAYSYLVTQCAVAADRPTCKGNYTNPGIAETLTTWMRYIACEGQINMARIGYSPLPANLSQEVANSIGRMNGTPPETLTAANCANPRFTGSFGNTPTSPKDPLAPDQPAGGTGSPGGATGGPGGATTGATNNGPAGGPNAPTANGPATTVPGAAAIGGPQAVGPATATTLVGATADPGAASEVASGPDAAAAGVEDLSADVAGGPARRWRDPAPLAYARPSVSDATVWPLLALLVVVLVPPTVGGVLRRRRR